VPAANQAIAYTDHPMLLRSNSKGSGKGNNKVARVKSETEAEAQAKSCSAGASVKESGTPVSIAPTAGSDAPAACRNQAAL